MTETELQNRIQAYLRDNFLYMRPELSLSPDDSLLRAGVIDSLGVMEVIDYLEKLAGIKVEEDEITEANFGSLSAMVAYVRGKMDRLPAS